MIALSHSGETEELTRLLETLKRIGATLIAMTGDPTSTLARAADRRPRLQCLQGSLPDEPGAHRQHHRGAGPRRRAGDDRAGREGVQPDDFADLHPRGTLGKRARRVERLMHTRRRPAGRAARRRRCARSSPRSPAGGMGITCVVDGDGRLLGVVTDGDVRRADRCRRRRPGADRPPTIMSRSPVTVAAGHAGRRGPPSAGAAQDHRGRRRRRRPRRRGVVHLHDLWRTGLV